MEQISIFTKYVPYIQSYSTSWYELFTIRTLFPERISSYREVWLYYLLYAVSKICFKNLLLEFTALGIVSNSWWFIFFRWRHQFPESVVLSPSFLRGPRKEGERECAAHLIINKSFPEDSKSVFCQKKQQKSVRIECIPLTNKVTALMRKKHSNST